MRPSMWSSLVVAVVVCALAASYIFTRSGRGGTTGVREVENHSRERASRDAAEGKPTVSLSRAADLGLSGWQPAVRDEDPTKDHSDLVVPGGVAAAIELAHRRNDLDYIETSSGPGLSGVIQPQDPEAVAISLLVRPVRVRGLSDAPPSRIIHMIAETVAAAVELVCIEPSATRLVGQRATDHPDVCQRLEASARQWPESARVWRIMAVPPDYDLLPSNSLAVNCRPGDAPRVHIDRLRSAGLFTQEPESGVWPTAYAQVSYQNSQGGDRWLSLQLVYDAANDRWVLLSIESHPSMIDAIRMARADRVNEYDRHTHTLDLTMVLSNHVVTTDGLLTTGSTR